MFIEIVLLSLIILIIWNEIKKPSNYPPGIVISNGIHWQNIRRFTLRHLRDLGMGKSKFVSHIHYEAADLIKVMKKQAGIPAPVPKALTPAEIIDDHIKTLDENDPRDYIDDYLIEMEKQKDDPSSTMLPYTEAFITEVLRYSSLGSLGVFRTVQRDTSFGGYTIQEKDNALGETLARMELFIFLTAMLQELQFSVPPNKTLDLSPNVLIAFHQPKIDQDILITVRN
ncbi:cytochrome P450 2L1, partial [Armadillidium vulgare]